MKNGPVLILAETGFIIRNLLLGYFADELSKHRKLIVAVQNPDDTKLQSIIKGKNITLIPFPFESYNDNRTNWQRLFSWDNWIYGMQQAKKDNISIKIQTKLFEGKSSWKKRLVGRIPYWMGRSIKFLGINNSIEDLYLRNYILKKPITKEWIAILQELNPELILSTMLTHSMPYRCSTDLPMIVAANSLKIKTCSLVQSWDNLSSKTAMLPRWVNRYFTWSQSMSAELLQYNPRISPAQITITGSPQYDYHLDKNLLISRDSFMLEKGLNPQRPYVLIGTGTSRWMPDEMEKIVKLCSEIFNKIPGMQVLIRLHPKDNAKRWAPFKDKLVELGVYIQKTSPDKHMDLGGFIPPIDFYSEQVNCIYHSAVVINSSSSLTVDAAILNKPAICIAYDLRPDQMFPEGRSLMYSKSVHFSKLVDTGGVSVAHSEEELINHIQAYIENPSLHINERKRLVQTVTDQVELKAGIRLSNSILNLCD